MTNVDLSVLASVSGREACQQIGVQLLRWARLVDDYDRPVVDQHVIDLFVRTIGHTSIPEACEVISSEAMGIIPIED